MFCRNGWRRSAGAVRGSRSSSLYGACRELHGDGRNRLSTFWTPTQSKATHEHRDGRGHDLLVRAGFLRQAHSGIFHLLPLGLRVQDKIERLIDRHMRRLGASKVSLSSLSSEALWQRSGRLDGGRGSEFFRLQDRKQTQYLLSPTHEEEITTIVANSAHSHRDLPLRLYQFSRKYRDEARPRQGLLRGREFIMKDLYTFDATEEQARQTYEDVRTAYAAFLDELKLRYLVAGADSGNMGGKLSHEYHYPSDDGEDTIVKCDTCDYAVNEEIYVGQLQSAALQSSAEHTKTWFAVSNDRSTLLEVHYPSQESDNNDDEHHDVNLTAVKSALPDIEMDFAGNKGEAWHEWMRLRKEGRAGTLLVLCDPRVPALADGIANRLPPNLPVDRAILQPERDGSHIQLTKARDGDQCPSCGGGHLHLHTAVEIGHTFHLSTRYSEPLNLRVTSATNEQIPVSMGCHGLGVSRLIGGVASLLSDSKGLNWPLAIAPFGLMVVPASKTVHVDADALYDQLSAKGIDVAIDDREQNVGWKLNDADLIGYPFIIVLGKRWRGEQKVAELQCRRLGVKEDVEAGELASRILEYSARL